jgi:putative NADPH-quinone reductase
MNTLIIYCHPVEGSFCSAMRDAAQRGLVDAGHDVEIIDLAKDGFDPIMGLDEWQVYMSRSGQVPIELERYAQLMRKAEIVVFVYPTWWSGVPAQLKGWFDRVLVPDVAFSFSDDGKVQPALEHVHKMFILTTYGSPKLYVRLVNDNGRRLISRALRIATKKRARATHLGLYEMDKATDTHRREFLQEIEKTMARA